jgi:hypothetical protein
MRVSLAAALCGLVAVWAPVALLGCSRAASESSAAAATGPNGGPATHDADSHAGVLFVAAAPDGEVAPLVVNALAQAARERRTLVVYVGATWCEPCQRFHEAALRGELDTEFPSLTLLEFDLDRDRDRLSRAGYRAKYIPLFALPDTSGTASDQMLSGGIKGEGAVGFIAPRLKALLER